MKITFFGTTTLLFEDNADQIMFDAHLTRPSLTKVMFGKLATDKETVSKIITDYKINRLKAVFISHTHHDHVMDAPLIAVKTKAVIYGSKSALNVGRGGEVPDDQLVLFHPQDEFCIGDFKIKVLKSVHSAAHFYNNDLGMTIDKPLVQPARKKDYREGGSYDFLIEHKNKRYLIRPSFNFVENELSDIKADVLFLGIAGLSRALSQVREQFFSETAAKVCPQLIIPVHWDNFFCPLTKPAAGMPRFIEDTELSFHYLSGYCSMNDISLAVMLPMTSMDL